MTGSAGPIRARRAADAGQSRSRDAAFKKGIIERALGAAMTHHLGYAPGATKPAEATNHRNGSNGKTVLTDEGPLPIAVPRDRQARSSRS